MGEQNVPQEVDERQLRVFMKALLDDVHALERMLDEDRFETGVRRIGAEMEMFLVDAGMRPAPVAPEVLAKVSDPRLTTELARFNLEANLSPLLYGGDCLSALEREATELLALASNGARTCGADVLLCGILPTLKLSDLGLENMTPAPRYERLNRVMTRLRGGVFNVVIKGLDELETTHDNVMLESANTSFQVHFQVAPREFARLYNLAQAVSAPVLAAAVNSPVLLGHRLWQETRVALFQKSTDHRSTTLAARGHRPRVSFGDHWIERSILEIFREDIARFRVVLATDCDERPLEVVARGEVPTLRALRLHNGTVWRWNRACYGISEGKAHLRIENRVLPAGPTVLDEIANASFFFGLMSALADEYPDITKALSFDDAKSNFYAAARHGLNAQLSWTAGRTLSAPELILDELLPQARAGLTSARIDPADIERYLGVIEERVRSRQTGSQWTLRSLSALGTEGTPDSRQRTLTAGMLLRSQQGLPVHRWSLTSQDEAADWRHGYRTVGQFMSTDLFTVRPGDLVDLAASVMDWEHIRHVPVEDDDGRLVGLVSHRALLRLVARGLGKDASEPVTVASIMKPDPVTVNPATPTLEAIELMRRHKLGCLPIVERGRLVGVITEHDFLLVAAKLFEDRLRGGP